MPDGKMGMDHPGFPRTPKVFTPEDKKRLAEPPARHAVTPQGSFDKNYTAARQEGTPFGVGGGSPGGSHGNHDSPGRDRSGPINKPGKNSGGGRY